MNSLAICSAIVACVALYLAPCQAEVVQPPEVQPNPQPDQEPKVNPQNPATLESTNQNAAPSPPPFIPPNLPFSLFQPLIPKIPSFRLTPPTNPFGPQFSTLPDLVSPQIFLQPDPLYYIVKTIAELPSKMNLNEQIFFLQKFLQDDKLSSSFVTYIHGILFLLHNHEEFKKFLESIADIKQEYEYSMSIKGRANFGPQFDINASTGPARGGFGSRFGLSASAGPGSSFGLPAVQASYDQSFFLPQSLSFDPVTSASFDQLEMPDYDTQQDDYDYDYGYDYEQTTPNEQPKSQPESQPEPKQQ